MNSLLIFGATGRTGRHLAIRASAAGKIVTGVSRRPGNADNGGATLRAADALVPESLPPLFAEARPDAVVWLAGGGDLRVEDEGAIAVIEATIVHGVRRFILVSSLGCGSSRARASERLLAAIGDILAAKTRAEDHLRATQLDWTIIRAGGLTEATATGRARLFQGDEHHGLIARSDLAGLILTVVDDGATIGRVKVAIDPTIEYPAQPMTMPPQYPDGQ
jgi:uncharacterized protein YbjT (DUF2867 family)